ncbi:GmrSD restriction endonuclease domain-containing protein [Flexivirga oryzae]|uniref:GmrSD restriction endonucleases N-terminal domain-containing protein n=1 Tax=Flexivirga oryzae TaxID=1794944 RepID=A0A839N1G9_9MICO|nr:hypothetical protein [Flexivirga oryzae]
MAGSYEKPITIEAAIREIVARRYVLPSIQRNFTWRMDQICRLFDSVMRHYPINSLMLWQVQSEEVREGFRFYSFLEKYVERFAENNPNFDTRGHGEFYAVMDGQQRLTSFYIGLKGTYAVKKPRLWWPKAYEPAVLPPRRLFLNLAKPLDPDLNDGQMLHDFRFLTVEEAGKKPSDEENLWFEVGRILGFPAVETDDEIVDHVLDHLAGTGHAGNIHARKTLQRLYFSIRRETNLNYYVETSQEIDRVLDIFIRTNQGGTPLSFSDLLMSIASANWEDARERVDELVNLVRTEFQFSIDRNFVMKTAVMVTDGDVRFQVKNFGADNVAKIRESWDDIRDSIVESFRMIARFGLNDASLRAKNAAIPIVYYLFHRDRDLAGGQRGRFTVINRLNRYPEDRNRIRQWLLMSLLRGVFGRAADSVLTNLRGLIHSNLDVAEGFPLAEIISSSRGTARDLTFDDELIERMLHTQTDNAECFSILALLQPDVDITQILHIDHLHPAAAFSSSRLEASPFVNQSPEIRAFYEAPENWNAIVNLHLLTEAENTSKQDKPLGEWLDPLNGRTTLDPMIPAGTDLSFEAFPAFVEARGEVIKERLRSLISHSATNPEASASPSV